MTSRTLRPHRQIARLDALDAGLLHVLPGGGQRTLRVDATASVLDYIGAEPELARIDRRPPHAEVGGEPGNENCLDSTPLEIAVEPGLQLAVGLDEGRIAVDLGVVALADDELGVRNVDPLVDGGALGALHTMVGPQDLVAVGQLDALEGLLAGVG